MNSIFNGWTKGEKILLTVSWTATILVSVYSHSEVLSTVFALTGIWCALASAKGQFISRVLSVLTASLYAFISFQNHYYGETLSRVCVLIPMSVYSLYTWYKNTNSETKSVEVKKLTKKDVILLAVVCVVGAVAMYALLSAFNTEKLLLSTFSMTTTVCASFLLARRNSLAFLFYVRSDIVLLIIWSAPILAGDLSLIPMICSPTVYLICDSYGYISFKKREQSQAATR